MDEVEARWHVDRGRPTSEEVAALAVVIALRPVGTAGTGAQGPQAGSAWIDRTRALRGPLPHGPHAWRASSLPR